MKGSPLDEFLRALDDLDADAAMALMAPDCRLLTAVGRSAVGTEAVRALLAGFLARLYSTTHRVTAEWHVDGVWIAEVDAAYEFKDRLRIGDLPRAFVARGGSDGLSDVRAYGAHEALLDEDNWSEQGLMFAGHWRPPL
jgi:limonene-1,2-epoxide hydrolase